MARHLCPISGSWVLCLVGQPGAGGGAEVPQKPVTVRRRGPRPAVAGVPLRDTPTTWEGCVQHLWPTANPSPRVAEILQDPDLVHGRVDFHPRLRGALEPLITGLIEHQQTTRGRVSARKRRTV